MSTRACTHTWAHTAPYAAVTVTATRGATVVAGRSAEAAAPRLRVLQGVASLGRAEHVGPARTP